jgi:hypothetical protein
LISDVGFIRQHFSREVTTLVLPSLRRKYVAKRVAFATFPCLKL